MARHNPTTRGTHPTCRLNLARDARVAHAFGRCASGLARALVALALIVAPAVTLALAQSGRRTPPSTTNKTTSPSSTQRPRRASTPTAEKKPTPGQPASTSTAQTTSPPVSILPDDAPPPPVFKPKPVPKPIEGPDASEEVGPDDVVRITSNLVTVPASVVDAYGRSLTGLRVEDFELRVDGQVKTINDISYSDTPVRLVLLFDNSSSLSVARDFEKQAATRFFRMVMRPVDQAAIYTVSTDVDLVQPLTSNVNSLVRTVENFGKPEGATRLFDAIVMAASYLRPQQGRKVIIVVSDGEDTLSDTDFEEALQRAQAADCQIYAVQTKQIEYVMQTGQPLGNANLRALAAERRMQEFASQTGGAVYSPLSVNDLDAAFAQISADLAQQYVLGYYPADEKQDGRFRAISLRVVSHPNARVRARKGYYASKAGMKSAVPRQMISTEARPVASINSSDTVPKEANVKAQTSTPAPASSPTSGGSTAPDLLLPTSSSLSSSQQSLQAAPASNPPPKTQNEVLGPRPATTQNTRAAGTEPSPSTQPPPPAQPPPSSSSTSPATQASQAPAQPATPTEGAPVKPVSGGVLNGKALNLPKPDYPRSARVAGASGTVIVEVTVDETGKVIEARALSGHPMLRSAAVAAARQARFAPTKLSGQPIKVTGVISYNFSIK